MHGSSNINTNFLVWKRCSCYVRYSQKDAANSRRMCEILNRVRGMQSQQKCVSKLSTDIVRNSTIYVCTELWICTERVQLRKDNVVHGSLKLQSLPGDREAVFKSHQRNWKRTSGEFGDADRRGSPFSFHVRRVPRVFRCNHLLRMTKH